jgi:hypothetical protein
VFRLADISLYSVSIAFRLHVAERVTDGLLALMPLTSFFVFGTQTDVLRAWAFWRRGRASPTAVQHVRHDGTFDLAGGENDDGDASASSRSPTLLLAPESPADYKSVIVLDVALVNNSDSEKAKPRSFSLDIV